MKRFYFVSMIITLSITTLSFAQLLEENFNYTALDGTELVDITSTLWESSSTPGAARFNNSSLSYSGYASSGVGGSAVTVKNTIKNYIDFISITSGSMYCSFLINLTNLPPTTADYPIAFTSTENSTSYYIKFWLQGNGSNFRFGLSKSTPTPSIWTAYNYNIGTTYLVVIRYDFITGTSNNLLKLYVFSGNTIGETEDLNNANYSSSLVDDGSSDATALVNFVIKQIDNNSFIGIQIDGIRIATSWSQAPVPVELSSFSAYCHGNAVNLKWQTKTEIENYGFEVERKSLTQTLSEGEGLFDWTKIGFVNGHGNCNSPKNYTFVDNSVTSGKYVYRLKQIDTDGKYEFSKEVEVDLGTPKTFYLGQNYPNPFNPTTRINYSLPVDGEVKLELYTLEGELVTNLVNERMNAGNYSVDFNAENLASGMYIYKLFSNGFVQTKKMILAK